MGNTAVATAARKRQGLVIRRIPDPETGKLVTYLPSVQLARLLGLAASTINTWATAGLIRSPGVLASHRHCSVADATRVRKMTRRERLALGILVTPESEMRKSKAIFDEKQQKTIPVATQHHEHWDDFDLDYVITCVNQGVRFEVIAKALGRSYSSVCNIAERLREAGDLPPAKPGDELDWYSRALSVLTSEERAALEGDRAD